MFIAITNKFLIINFNSKMEERVSSKFNLEERTAIFGENTIKFLKSLTVTVFNKPLITQLIRSASSVGANYMEANNAESKKDFIHKIGICKKEVTETKHWLRMVNQLHQDRRVEIEKLWKEAQELTLIFSKILASSRKKTNN